MLEFKKIDENTIEELRRLSENCPYLDSAYSPGQLLMWKDSFPAEFAVDSSCLIIHIASVEEPAFGGYLYPYVIKPDNSVANNEAWVEKALDSLDAYMEKTSERLQFVNVNEAQLCHLGNRYTNFRVGTDRRWWDYIYRSADMAAFIGRKYSALRNHINKFNGLYKEAVFRPLTENDQGRLEQFWKDYDSEFSKTSESALEELTLAKRFMKCTCDDNNYYAGTFLGDKLISICYGEKFGDCIVVHIEKSLAEYDGVYKFMVNEFAKLFGGNATYMNREDDSGDRGLRISKLQYLPCQVLKRSRFLVENELEYFNKDTQVLASCLIDKDEFTLEMLRDSDSDDYDRLCLNDEHNKLWGYDYREDCENPEAGYFLKAARGDLENHSSLSLAVRKAGTFIGEVVYFVFDGRGSCKLGWRLLPEYCGKGWASHIFRMAGNFGIYELGLEKITAYCFKENVASAKAMAHSMKEVAEDDKYKYFERTV